MISFGKWPRVLFASVLAMALWTFISVNTNIFSVDGKFDGFMYFTSYILVIGVWALVAVKINVSDKFYKAISIFIFALTPFFCMQVAMILSGAAEYSFGIYFINIMFYVAIMAIILAITRSMKWTAIVTNLVAYLFNLSSCGEVTQISDGLVLNCGTISESRLNAMLISGKTAKSREIPIVLDPVGVGISKFRTSAVHKPDCCCNGYSGVGYNVNR